MSGKQKTEGVRRIWDKYKFVALVALAGAVLLLWPGGDGKTAERASPQAAALVEAELQQEMEDILGRIQGVGEVQVLLTVESDGSLFFGGNIYEAVETLEEMGAAAVGINCSTGPDQLFSVVENMRKRVQIPLIVKPNAGMPVIDENGCPVYSMGAEEFAGHMKRMTEIGANIVGGCCGTTPEYIRQVKEALGRQR